MTFLTRWIDQDREWPRGCWPNHAQRLLLQACLLEDKDAAISAWQKWEQLVPWDFIDGGSHRLLLLLHHRLQSLGLTSINQGRLAGVARYYWVQTELLQRQAVSVLQKFEAAGIPTMLLKGAALNATVYRTGFRAMNDLDVVVRREDAERSIQLLNALDASPPVKLAEESIAVGHGVNFSLKNGPEVDLHWDFFHSRSLSFEQQDQLWSASVPVQIGPATSHVLCPADQLLHTCEHGARYNETPPFRWLADAVQIIRNLGDDLDWERLIQQAREHEAVLQVHRTLIWLRDHMKVSIPDRVLSELERRNVSLPNRVEYRVTTQRGLSGQHTFWQTFPEHVFAWRRQKRGESLLRYHCLQHNICDGHQGRFREFAMVGLLQTGSRLRSVVPKIRYSHRFVTGTLPEDQIAGCHDVERHGRHVFRWTDREATLTISIPKGEYTVFVQLLPWRKWAEDLETALRVDFNRNAVAVEPANDSVSELKFAINGNMFIDGPGQRLTFRCTPLTEVPKTETRHLGLPLVDVRFQAIPSQERTNAD